MLLVGLGFITAAGVFLIWWDMGLREWLTARREREGEAQYEWQCAGNARGYPSLFHHLAQTRGMWGRAYPWTRWAAARIDHLVVRDAARRNEYALGGYADLDGYIAWRRVGIRMGWL